jgi:4-amino-4-deoxy-L-arabinose transferase-like glycosyltransferase
MKETRLTIPELSLIAGTRAALGGGLALLLADRLSREQRKAAGWALFLVGVLTTIPLGITVLCKRR